MGGGGSQLKNLKNWWKFEDLEKFTCIRYWSTDSVNFKSWTKSENFWYFWPLLTTTKPPTKLLLFFWYTVNPCEYVGAIPKKIQVKSFLIKIIVSSLHITQFQSLNIFAKKIAVGSLKIMLIGYCAYKIYSTNGEWLQMKIDFISHAVRSLIKE